VDLVDGITVSLDYTSTIPKPEDDEAVPTRGRRGIRVIESLRDR